MKIMIIVGARPNFMKAAPLIRAIHDYQNLKRQSRDSEKFEHVLVHTGQHYDEAMSGSFFADLNLPAPDVHLGVGSSSHAAQTAEIMRKFEEVLLREKPEVLVVVGDVNSTAACALVAAKISFDSNGTRPLIVHVEAGLRSGDSSMPEEVNRIVTDHISDLLFVTEESGVRNLKQEGVPDEKIHFVGNTMIDSLLSYKNKADESPVLRKLGLKNGGVARYALLTLHRPSNVDRRETFLNILEGLQDFSRSCPVIFPAHPRTQKRIAEFGFAHFFATGSENRARQDSDPALLSNGIHWVDPQGYIDFMCLMKNASLVLTDSGGIQEETTCLGIPCVTLRESTERPITVTCGTNIIAGTQREKIRKAILQQTKHLGVHCIPEKWDGHAGERIFILIAAQLQQNKQLASVLG